MDGSSDSTSSGSPLPVDQALRVDDRFNTVGTGPKPTAQGQWNDAMSIIDMDLGPETGSQGSGSDPSISLPDGKEGQGARSDASSRAAPRNPPRTEAHPTTATLSPHGDGARSTGTAIDIEGLSALAPSNHSDTADADDHLAPLRRIQVRVPKALSARVTAMQQHIDHMAQAHPPFCCSTHSMVVLGSALSLSAVVFGLSIHFIRAPSYVLYLTIPPSVAGLLLFSQAAARHFWAHVSLTE